MNSKYPEEGDNGQYDGIEESKSCVGDTGDNKQEPNETNYGTASHSRHGSFSRSYSLAVRKVNKQQADKLTRIKGIGLLEEDKSLGREEL